jgi:hypothetical protein
MRIIKLLLRSLVLAIIAFTFITLAEWSIKNGFDYREEHGTGFVNYTDVVVYTAKHLF